MPNVPWIPTVDQVADGQDVSAAVVNPIVTELSQREEYLYQLVGEINSKSSIVLVDQPVLDTTGVVAGTFVYMETDNGGNQGLALAQTQFDFLTSRDTYGPDPSAYVLGLTSYKSGSYANVVTSGLVTLADASVLLQSGETPISGPYYLSSKEPGKMTANPGGLAIYVGFMLPATNGIYQNFNVSLNINELMQFITSYKFNILDRPAGTATLSAGTWTVANALTKVGWVAASGLTGQPTGAVFKYNIPGDTIIDLDTALSATEKESAKRLGRMFPPNPAHFNGYFVNGVKQRQKNVSDLVDTQGIYCVNAFGIWWFNASTGYQPWASIGTSVTSANWNWTSPGVSDIQYAANDYLRPKQEFWMSKLNPALNGAIVTSIKPATSSTPIVITDANLPANTATAGDLLIDVPILTTGAASTTTGVASITPTAAGLQVVYGPVVQQIAQGSGITTQTDATTGIVTISANSTQMYGQITDIQPDNAKLKYVGLHSYLELGNPATRLDGLFGKLILSSLIASTNLKFTVMLCGDTSNSSGSTQNITFQYQYAVSNPKALVGSNASLNYNINTTMTTGYFTLAIPVGYTAYDELTFTPATMIVPAANIQGSSIVNFKLTRNVPASTPYTGSIGILGIFWNF